jgi:hypothetical protein
MVVGREKLTMMIYPLLNTAIFGISTLYICIENYDTKPHISYNNLKIIPI